MICDFCSSDQPRFCYATSSEVMIAIEKPISIGPQAGLVGAGFDERWAACDGCAELIDRRDMRRLIKRVLPTLPESSKSAFHERMAKEGLRHIYTQFFAKLSQLRRMTIEEINRPVEPFKVEPCDVTEETMPKRDWGPMGFQGLYICDGCESRFTKDNGYGGEVGELTFCDHCWAARNGDTQHRAVGKPQCPRCGSDFAINGDVSTSRRDNKTAICNDCGRDEALRDFVNRHGSKNPALASLANVETKHGKKILKTWKFAP